MSAFIFVISVNCSKITAVMLSSFHRHHDRKIHVFGTAKDFDELGSIRFHANNVFINIENDSEALEKFKSGHSGTGYIFSKVLLKQYGEYNKIIHVDSDIYFKRESISVIEDCLDVGYDIVGTRRCYGNNPSGIPNLSSYPDTVSTYILGLKLNKMPAYSPEELYKYCCGYGHPLGWPVLDFFDGVTHGMINNGAKILYLNQNEFGSQDSNGKKNSSFPSNMHLDIGKNLAHFGGVGSGYAYINNKSNPEISYAKWAVGRWSLFSKLFYDENVECNEPAVYGSDGRWVGGNYDANIYMQVLSDLQ